MTIATDATMTFAALPDTSAADDLVAYIKELAGLAELDLDQELLDTGLISSLEMVDVLLFVNRRFGVELDPTELVPDNLGSIRRMLALVDRCRSVPG